MATGKDRLNGSENAQIGTWEVKTGMAEQLKGGVIMDVVTAEEAKIAEDAGACAVMALERVPADIRKDGGVARMSDPTKIIEIQEAVTIPVMAKCRIGHFAEAQVLQALGIDYIGRVRSPYPRRRRPSRLEAQLHCPLRLRLPAISAKPSAESAKARP